MGKMLCEQIIWLYLHIILLYLYSIKIYTILIKVIDNIIIYTIVF